MQASSTLFFMLKVAEVNNCFLQFPGDNRQLPFLVFDWVLGMIIFVLFSQLVRLSLLELVTSFRFTGGYIFLFILSFYQHVPAFTKKYLLQNYDLHSSVYRLILLI